jgi:hypothetical protein
MEVNIFITIAVVYQRIRSNKHTNIFQLRNLTRTLLVECACFSSCNAHFLIVRVDADAIATDSISLKIISN